MSQSLVGQPFFFTGIQLGRFPSEPGPGEPLELVGEGRFDCLTPVAEAPAVYKLVDPFDKVAIKGERHFGLGHGSMTNHHTSRDAGEQAAAPDGSWSCEPPRVNAKPLRDSVHVVVKPMRRQ